MNNFTRGLGWALVVSGIMATAIAIYGISTKQHLRDTISETPPAEPELIVEHKGCRVWRKWQGSGLGLVGVYFSNCFIVVR